MGFVAGQRRGRRNAVDRDEVLTSLLAAGRMPAESGPGWANGAKPRQWALAVGVGKAVCTTLAVAAHVGGAATDTAGVVEPAPPGGGCRVDRSVGLQRIWRVVRGLKRA